MNECTYFWWKISPQKNEGLVKNIKWNKQKILEESFEIQQFLLN